MGGARLLLLRHTAVSARHAGRCYGRTDAGLSAEGMATARQLAAALANVRFDFVFASPSRRTRVLAMRISAHLGAPMRIDQRLAERWFGSWEGRSWNDIWAEEGDGMNGMIDAPGSYRPGGGETTVELADRVLDWFRAIPAGNAVVAATHGGPIAALAGTLQGLLPRQWLGYIPAPGKGLWIEPRASGWRITPWPVPDCGANARG